MIDDVLFQKTIEDSLSFLDENIRKYFLSDVCIPYWKKAFVHESMNVDINYEKYEFLGDATIGYGFKLYLVQDLKVQKTSIVSGLISYYLSENYQHVISKKLNFDKIVSLHPKMKINDKILEDLMEAYFGVLTIISRKLWLKNPSKFPYPTECGRMFFKWYFSKMDTINLSHGKLINKTFFNQMFYFFSGEATTTGTSWVYDSKSMKIKVPFSFISGIGNYSKELKEKLQTLFLHKGLSLDELMENTILIYEELGFTTEWYKEEIAKTTFKEYPDLISLAKENGLSRFTLRRNDFSSYNLYAQGIDSISRTSITRLLYEFKEDDINSIKEQSYNILINMDMTKFNLTD